MASQLQYKQKIDSMFEESWRYSWTSWTASWFKKCERFKQAEVDLKYQAIDAVKNGDLDLLAQALPYIDAQMAVSLCLVSVQRDHIHLIGCLLEKISGEGGYDLRGDKTIEPLILIGLDDDIAGSSIKPPLHAEVADFINRSRLLCLFKILYHKYIFLGVESIFDVLQALLYEQMYVR